MPLSLGPWPLSVVLLALAFLLAVGVGAVAARRTGAEGRPARAVVSLLFDMLLVGVAGARAAFVLAWLPQYLAEPLAIVRLGDGGFVPWVGALVAIGFGSWRVRTRPLLRRPLTLAVVVGITAWALLAGGIALIQHQRMRLPATPLTTVDGRPVALQAFSGRPVVINLWATWCPPCRREMPILAAAQRRNPQLAFVFVNQGETAASVRAWLNTQSQPPRNVLFDPWSRLMQATGTQGLPTTLFFDAEGRLVEAHVGELTQASLARKLRRWPPPATHASDVAATPR